MTKFNMKKIKLNAGQLRISKPTNGDLARVKRNPIYFVLDRIIDTYNTGSLFRLADAVSVKKIFLCGKMEYPPNSRIHKAAVGTENWIDWERKKTTLEAVKELKKKGVQTIAVEQDKRSISYKHLRPTFPVAIVVGNESKGLPSVVLDEVHTIVELPMYGINNSFNVWGAASVVVYKILEFL